MSSHRATYIQSPHIHYDCIVNSQENRKSAQSGQTTIQVQYICLMKIARRLSRRYLQSKTASLLGKNSQMPTKLGPHLSRKPETSTVRQRWQYGVHLSNSRGQPESFVSGCWVYRSIEAVLSSMFPFFKEFGIRRTQIPYQRLPRKSVLPVEIPQSHESGQILRLSVEIGGSLYHTMAGNLAEACTLRQLSQVGELSRQWGYPIQILSWRFEEDFLSLPKQYI